MKLLINSQTYGIFEVSIDDEDYHKIEGHTLFISPRSDCIDGHVRYYVSVSFPTGKRGANTKLLHRLILPGYKNIDHIDHNGLNNCKSNLRPATTSQNGANQRKRKSKCTSQYKGVHFHPFGKYQARIKYNYKTYSLGLYFTELEAAIAYNKAASEIYGPYAHLNILKEQQ